MGWGGVMGRRRRRMCVVGGCMGGWVVNTILNLNDR